MNEVNSSPKSPPQQPSAGPVRGAPLRRPPKRKRGGCMVFAILFAAILVFVCVIAVIGAFVAIVAKSDSLVTGSDLSVSQRVIHSAPHTSAKIAVVDIQGVIMGTDSSHSAGSGVVSNVLTRVSRDSDVVAVVLNMDTPGGEVIASDEIYKAVADLDVPVVACMRGVCASGGYYIAAAADHIVANEVTLTGSIGVIIPRYKYHGLLEKIGVETAAVTSGEMKDMLSGGRSRATAEEEVIDEYIQGLVDETFRRFCMVVAAGRNQFVTWEDVKDAPFGDGRILLGRRAMELGLVDELGYFEHAVEAAKRLAGVDDANVVRFKRDFTLSDLFFAKAGANVKVETGLEHALPKLDPTRMYFIMPNLAE